MRMMKHLLQGLFLGLWLLLAATADAVAYRVEEVPNVQLQNRGAYVSNPDGILSSEAVARINDLCDSLRRARLAEVAVVAVREVASEDIFSFAMDLFSMWGVGRADGDNGVGILLVESAREIRFVTGDGVEGILPDAICKRIQINEMLPAFRRGDYSAGMVAGMVAVARRLAGGEALAEEEETHDFWLILLFVVGLPMLFVVVIWLLTSRCPRCHRMTLKQQGPAKVSHTATFRETEYTYVCTHCGKVVHKHHREYLDRDNHSRGGGGGPFIGGFGGSRGFGGGSMGGGFGGGHFGGGGAGSRW